MRCCRFARRHVIIPDSIFFRASQIGLQSRVTLQMYLLVLSLASPPEFSLQCEAAPRRVQTNGAVGTADVAQLPVGAFDVRLVKVEIAYVW